MSQILVIEMTDRNINSVTEVDDIESGLLKANELLKDHMEQIGYLSEFEAEDDMGSEWDKAEADTLNAWCNYQSTNWDAHVFVLDPPAIGHVVRVIETNADGNGTDITVHIQFEQTVTSNDVNAFIKTVRTVKAESIASNDPYDTFENLIADAIEVFQCEPYAREKNLSAHIIVPQEIADFIIEV